jgi:hypothetical protein
MTKKMEGKSLRIGFADGEIAEIKLLCVMIHDCHEDCNVFVYDVISTNQNQKYTPSSMANAMLGHFEDIVSIELIGD